MNDTIELEAVETHNLKKIDVQIPHRSITAISGVSGSGKSSLAFDTLFAEGQRRFVESLSTYARQFLQRMDKPPVGRVRNILPAVALKQKNSITHARSTVATLTEIADHLGLVFAHIGVTTCPDCHQVVRRDTPAAIARALERRPGARLIFLADVPVLEVQTPQQALQALVADGYQRLYLDGEAVHVGEADVERLLERRSFPVVVDRLKITDDDRLRLREAIEHAFRLGDGAFRVVDVSNKEAHEELTFSRTFTCNGCGRAFIEPLPALFSFNSPIGACQECSGFGRTSGLDWEKVVPNPGLTLEQNAIHPFASPSRARQRQKLLQAARERGIPTDIAFGDLRPEDQRFIFKGEGKDKGVHGFFEKLKEKRHKPQARIMIARYRGYTRCEVCDGSRFSPEARCVTVAGRTIAELYALRVREAQEAFHHLELDDDDRARVAPLLDEITSRLDYMAQVGLGYLSLDRQSRTLSGGEVQRIQLTSSLGRTLTDTLYVLDEPTAGLHARDTLKLLAILERLRDIGNAVVVVEHDPDMIRGADWAIELGPSGGEGGGQLLYQGPTRALIEAETPTGEALRGRRPRAASLTGALGFDARVDPHITIVGARENNLRGLDVQLPLRRLVCITGVSGSGKTSLVHRCLFDTWRRDTGATGVDPVRVERLDGVEQVQELVFMRQGGLGRSSRSTVASYSKAWDAIRKIYGTLTESARKGLGPGSFSFNTPGGRCEKCEGSGLLTIEMHFMADIEIVCDACDGQRFMEKVLGVRWRGRNISEVLQMTVDEAMVFFDGARAVTNRLEVLREVGLGYLRLGQTTSTLSGGEAQRLLLASYLGQKSTARDGGMLFIFDEPTVGLHLQDIAVLVGALRRALDEGHSVLVVEHNTDFIAQADHIIDLGPEGGDGGGQIVVQGTPAEVAACEASWTGRFLREILEAPLD